MKLLKSILPIIVIAVIFIILFLKIDLQKVITNLKLTRMEFLFLAIIISISTYMFIDSDKWRRVLKAMNCHISFKESFLITNACAPIGFIMPLEFGEVVKAIYLSRKKGIRFERALSSVIFSKVLHLFSILFLLLTGLIFLKVSRYNKLPFYFLILLISIFGLGKVSIFLLSKFKKMHLRFYHSFKQLISAFKEIKLREKIELSVYALAYQSFELIIAYILFRAIDLNVPFSAILVFMPITILISLLPITISGLGTREITIIFLFSKYGSQEKLLTLGILLSFVSYILPAVAGLFFLRPFMIKIVRDAKISLES